MLLVVLVGCGGSAGFGAADAGGDASPLPDGALFGDSSTGPLCKHWVQRAYLAGGDGVLGTSDDVLEDKALVQEIDETDQVATETAYSGPGGDGKWGTDDDVIASQQRVIKSGSSVRIVRFSGPGTDGKWGTDDDVVASYRGGTLENGKVATALTYSSPGGDGVWRTADDVASERWVYAYGDGVTTARVREDDYNGAGIDGKWNTSDDQLAIVTSRFSDWGMFSTAAGADGKWGTKDDVATSRYTDLRKQNGFYQLLQTWKAGPDQVLFTNDDDISSTASTKCEAGVFDARIHSSPGKDGTWGTTDDTYSFRMRIEGCPTSCDGVLPGTPLDPR